MGHRNRRRSSESRTEAPGASRLSRFLRSWFVANSLLTGLFAAAWLILRSGTRPSRLAYPCQRAALSTASMALAAPLVGLAVAARRHVTAGLRSPAGVGLLVLAVAAGLAAWGYQADLDAYDGPVRSAPRDYRAQVFHVHSCPQDPVGDRFVGLESLLQVMGGHGLKFYSSAVAGATAGPTGIVGSGDVVLIKINYQWSQRGGSNNASIGAKHPIRMPIAMLTTIEIASTVEIPRTRRFRPGLNWPKV